MERAVGVSPAVADYTRFHQQISQARAREVQIPVDGRGLTFLSWGGPDRWWAAGTAEGRGVVVQGRRYPLDDVVLETVHDVEPYLSGRREYLRVARGGV